jgi:tetrahydromethanopterin S-methyltransferase subunit G
VKFSGALPAKRVNELLERVEKLQQAVKFAREEANNQEADEQKIGRSVLNYLFA